MLINLLDPGDIVSKELLDMVHRLPMSTTTVRQVFQTKTNDVPNFPYTEIPILPPEVYQKGLSGKEQVHTLPGMDPILVVKDADLFPETSKRFVITQRLFTKHLDIDPWQVD